MLTLHERHGRSHRKLADLFSQLCLVRLDDLVFGEQERGPSDDLALQFEAVSQFSEAEKQTVRELLEG